MSSLQDAVEAVAAMAKEAQAELVPLEIAGQPIPLFNRELSWLAFNRRVLGEAEDANVPLLERIKFLSIAANNLDEFFMIRVGELRDLISANVPGPGGWREQLDAIRNRSRRLLDKMYRCLGDELLPAMKKEGVRIERVADLGKKDRAALEEHFTREIEPILTPLAIDPSHRFPYVANLALNLALLLECDRGESHFAVVKIPESLPRLIPVGSRRFVLLEDVISSHVARFFPALKLRRSVAFRVTRNSDVAIKEEEVQDLLKSVESELRRRDRREVVWLEIESPCDQAVVDLLTRSLPCSGDDLFFASGPLKLGDLMQLYREIDDAKLKDAPFDPRTPANLATTEDIFSLIRRGDVLLHRPYDSFGFVIEFLQAAAEDPDVVAIKQTLYRTDARSPILEALATAAVSGKEVTAIVELQARFDEKKNITWARQLEEAGVQVVHGLVGIKTHTKMCLVVRREGSELRRYLHLSTGNYNAVTARLYTDLDLFTCDPDFSVDAAQLLNLLTGFSTAGVQDLIDNRDGPLQWRRLIVAPMDYQRWVIGMIERETKHAKDGKAAGIVAKMNALVEPVVIGELYKASRAGVKIQLVVRGICCLVPGLPAVSDNIEVISTIDRFLEHSRIFRFENGGAPEVYASSGDWMPRNFFQRIETTYPIRAEALVKRIQDQILPTALADNVKSYTLRSDGKYERRTREGPAVRSQEACIAIARAEAVRLGPYEEIIRKPGPFRRKAKKRKHK